MKRFWILILPIVFAACQEEVNLPLGTKGEKVPTIEATWTDSGLYNEVKISLSKDYYDSLDAEVVTDADVKITVLGTNKVIPFSYVSGTNSYKPNNPLERATVGENYLLTVKWDGKVFESEGVMLEAPTVDSLTWNFEEESLFRDEGYYIKVYGKVPFTEDNNYRIRVIENDTLKNGREDYLLFDDTFGLKFFEQGLQLGYAFEENDRVRLELFRLNRDAFDYLNQLVNLLFNDGGLFSPPPQNPVSNIAVVEGESEVLGYFLVSPLLVRTVVIQAKY